MAEPQERRWTPEEFFAWSERQTDRYEFVSGRPLRMLAGATNLHDHIVVNLLCELGLKLRGTGYRPFTGDGSVETYPGQIRRPDVGVDCGRRDPNAYKASDPRLVLEVLSPTTRDFDSFGKLQEYQGMAGLAHILFVDPNEALALVYSRAEGGAWIETRIEGLDAGIDLAGLGIALEMRAIYDGVEFPATPPHLVYETPR